MTAAHQAATIHRLTVTPYTGAHLAHPLATGIVLILFLATFVLIMGTAASRQRTN